MKQCAQIFVGIVLLLGSLAAGPATTRAVRVSPETWRQRAIQYAGKIEDADAKGRTHYELATCLAHAGDPTAANEAIKWITDPQLKVYSLTRVSKAYQEKGDIPSADAKLVEAAEVAIGSDNNSAHGHMVEVFLKLGRTDDAIAMVERLPKDDYRNWGFRDIAVNLGEQGKIAEADVIVEKHLPKNWKESCDSGLANVSADALRIEDFRKLVARLNDPKLRDRAYGHMVKALLKAGRAEEASGFADKIANEHEKAAARGVITATLLEKRSAEELLAEIDKAATREEKIPLQTLVYDKYLKANDLASAERMIEAMVKTVESAPREAQRSKFGLFDDAVLIAVTKSRYLDIAIQLKKQGDMKGSQERLERVRQVTLAVPEEAGISKTGLVVRLQQAQVELGNFTDARETLKQLDGRFHRSMTAGEVGVGLVKTGDVKGAIEVADFINDGIGKGSAVGEIAVELIRAGHRDSAWTLLHKLNDSRDDIDGFRYAGAEMIEVGHEAELEQWLTEFDSNVARAYFCMAAADVAQEIVDGKR